MNRCRGLARDLDALASRPLAELPEEVRRHVAICPACDRRLTAARLAQRWVTTAREVPEAPPGFAGRVVARLACSAGAGRPAGEVWQPAWKLVPTFAAVVAALCILYQTSGGVGGPSGRFAADGLTSVEYLVLDASAPDFDGALSALLEEVLE